MQSDFIEVSFRTHVDSGELLARLKDGEDLGSWEKDGELHIYWPREKWDETALDDLKAVLRKLGCCAKEGDFRISVVPDQDWNAVWAASLQPILLGRQLRIRQSWHEADPDFGGIELVIDPRRAFGTGYHATTQLVLEWLEESIRGGEQVLDVGTGTAILAMAAIRLGASSALGIDNDPVALECARGYASGNGFGAELELMLASFESLEYGKYDVVLANLDGRAMPRFCELLPRLMKRNGIACLSGLQEPDYGGIVEILARSELRIRAKRQREDWLALTVK